MASEYYAVCKAVQEALYLHMMFEETGLKVDSPLIIREDNKSCISFSKDPGEHKRTKHIVYRRFFVRDQVNDGEVSLTHVSSENQLADIFTKSFDAQRFIFLRNHLVVSRATLRFVTPTVLCVVQCTKGGKSLLEYMFINITCLFSASRLGLLTGAKFPYVNKFYGLEVQTTKRWRLRGFEGVHT